MQDALPFILLVVGLIAGGLAGYLWAARQGREAQARADAASRIEAELRGQLQQRDAELATTREKLSAEQQGRVAAETKVQNAAARLVEQQQQQAQSLVDLKAAQDKALADLREAFAALSLKALKETQPEFLRLANETFEKRARTAEGNLKARQEAIDGVVKPLKDQLAEYQKRLQAAETEQTKTLGAVRQQLEALQNQSQSLAGETNKLRLVLSSSHARGRWGEETLRRVVEAAGMSTHCDFVEQTAAGETRPDMLVKLPGDRIIIVDSKVPDLDFLGALQTADETTRREKLAAHAAKLKGTIQALAKREYPKQFPDALNKVVLFVPAESLLSAALEGDPNLIVDAAAQDILLATPSSLIALLYAVAMSWQQDAQTRNAREIGEAGKELFERVTKFIEHFVGIRDGLEKAGKAFEGALGSYERRVRPSGEKLIKLAGGLAEAELPEIKPADTALRQLPEAK
ncbi:MAG: DNA recombination protein RmuC [Verrucomicrobia bacterium]|nr:DNA recombination protein RmuC [Verrucomicrobiota bacterium]